jgi:hypothetical protein
MKIFIPTLFIWLFAHQLNGQCVLKTEKDSFTGLITRSTNYELVGNTARRNGELRFKVTQIFEKDTTIRLYLKIHRTTRRCFGAESKIMLKFGEEIFTLGLSQMNDCGINLQDYVELSPDTIIYLTEKKISAIRIKYANGFDVFDDFAVTNVRDEKWHTHFENKSDYFIRTLKCFE